ncbi:hypothetical protein M8J77_010862 [Diaphorina citri]|nr:hypothetical protein M8J77_010862 [Diaphorina citri]
MPISITCTPARTTLYTANEKSGKHVLIWNQNQLELDGNPAHLETVEKPEDGDEVFRQASISPRVIAFGLTFGFGYKL